jgi:hypothetical protein
MTNDKIDNLDRIRNRLDLDFSMLLDDLKDLPTDPNNDYNTIYDDSVLDTIDKLKNIVLRIRNIDYTIDMYKSKSNM